MGVSRDLKSEAPTCVYRYICGCDKRMHIPVLSVVVTFPSSKNFAAVKSCLRRWRTKKFESITTCALSAVSDVAQECMVCIRDMYLVSYCSVCVMGRGGFILHKIQDIYCQRLCPNKAWCIRTPWEQRSGDWQNVVLVWTNKIPSCPLFTVPVGPVSFLIFGFSSSL